MSLLGPDVKIISVAGTNYRWLVNAIETVLDILIQQDNSEGQRLRVGYFYQSRKPADVDPAAIVIPEELVSKLILYALKQGWEPTEPGLIEFFMYGEDVGPLDWSG